jgi:hypothetical protein
MAIMVMVDSCKDSSNGRRGHNIGIDIAAGGTDGTVVAGRARARGEVACFFGNFDLELDRLCRLAVNNYKKKKRK